MPRLKYLLLVFAVLLGLSCSVTIPSRNTNVPYRKSEIDTNEGSENVIPHSEQSNLPSNAMPSSKNQKEKEMLYEAYNMLHSLAQVGGRLSIYNFSPKLIL